MALLRIFFIGTHAETHKEKFAYGFSNCGVELLWISIQTIPTNSAESNRKRRSQIVGNFSGMSRAKAES
jgi:hypothetical protein